MKKSLLYLAIVGICIGLTGCGMGQPQKPLYQKMKERGKIVVGVKYDSKPFGFVDEDKKLKGFDVDISREIARRLLGNPDDVEFQQVTSSNRIFALTSGTVDMVAATMTINDKRKKIVDFSVPYFVAGQAIMVPKNSAIHTLKDLKGKKVIVVLGSTSEKNVRDVVPDAIIQGFRTYTDAFSAMRAGRGDALTTDDTILAGFLSEDRSFKILPERYTQEPYGIGFKKGKDSESFQQVVNMAISQMNADGTLKQLKRKWISSDK